MADHGVTEQERQSLGMAPNSFEYFPTYINATWNGHASFQTVLNANCKFSGLFLHCSWALRAQH